MSLDVVAADALEWERREPLFGQRCSCGCTDADALVDDPPHRVDVGPLGVVAVRPRPSLQRRNEASPIPIELVLWPVESGQIQVSSL